MDPDTLLKYIPLFSELQEADLRTLAQSVRLQKLKAGQVLFRKGDEGTALYLIKKGTVKIILPSAQGDEIIVTMFSKGDYFGEMALLDEESRSADAVAVQDSEVMVLRRSDFLSFLQTSTSATRSILAQLSRRLRKTDGLLEDTCFLNVSTRLAKKLLQLAQTHGRTDDEGIIIELHLTQKDLGDMIGATRESINKEIKILREKGLIRVEENRIRLCDVARLKLRAH